MKPARFIVFEGLDGSGKSTQLNMLREHMQNLQIPVAAAFEPSDSNAAGRLARDVIKRKEILSGEALALVFAADRAEHLQTEIIPLLDRGINVLCDRYVYSNLAYQNGDVPLNLLIEYNRASIEKRMPDAVFFIDTPPSVCVSRMEAGRDGQPELFETAEKLASVRNCYIKAFEETGNYIKVTMIDGYRPKEKVFSDVWKKINCLFK
ncbi:MAG: dTMP kinase [Defluviitaleaceae bacterium]|nr:dTMP kinase [Defluviitaleaceae bacterium]